MSAIPGPLESPHPHVRPAFEEQHAGFAAYDSAAGWVVIEGPSGAGGHGLTGHGADGVAYNVRTGELEIWDTKGISRTKRMRISMKDGPTAITVNLAAYIDELIPRVQAIPDLPHRALILHRLRQLQRAVRGQGPVPANVRLMIVSARAEGVTAHLRNYWIRRGVNLPIEFRSTRVVPAAPPPAPVSGTSPHAAPAVDPPSRGIGNRRGVGGGRARVRAGMSGALKAGAADLFYSYQSNVLAAQETVRAQKALKSKIADVEYLRRAGWWVVLRMEMQVPERRDFFGYDEAKPRFLCWRANWARTRETAINPPPTPGQVLPTRPGVRMREAKNEDNPCKPPKGYTSETSQLVVLDPRPPAIRAVPHFEDSGKLAGTYAPLQRLRWTGPVPDDALNRQLRIKTVFGQPMISIFLGRERLTLEDLKIETSSFECTILRPSTDYFLSDSSFRFTASRKGGADIFVEEYASRMQNARGTILWQELAMGS